jgi:hypothetical protein
LRFCVRCRVKIIDISIDDTKIVGIFFWHNADIFLCIAIPLFNDTIATMWKPSNQIRLCETIKRGNEMTEVRLNRTSGT